MTIRRDGVCVACAAALQAGSSAYWYKDERAVKCLECESDGVVPAFDEVVRKAIGDGPQVESQAHPTAEVSVNETTLTAEPVADIAGRSAQREYEKRFDQERARAERKIQDDAEWRAELKARRPLIGRLVTAFTTKPEIGPVTQSTKAWSVGAEGERRVADALGNIPDIEVLHDRLVPKGGAANIDHIVVGPAGVFVIDAKNYSGELAVRDVGRWTVSDLRLFVAGRDRTGLTDGVLKQALAVRSALGREWSEVPVTGVLCFVKCSWARKTVKNVNGVTVLWPEALHTHVRPKGAFTEDVASIAAQLRTALEQAS